MDETQDFQNPESGAAVTGLVKVASAIIKPHKRPPNFRKHIVRLSSNMGSTVPEDWGSFFVYFEEMFGKGMEEVNNFDMWVSKDFGVAGYRFCNSWLDCKIAQAVGGYDMAVMSIRHVVAVIMSENAGRTKVLTRTGSNLLFAKNLNGELSTVRVVKCDGLPGCDQWLIGAYPINLEKFEPWRDQARFIAFDKDSDVF